MNPIHWIDRLLITIIDFFSPVPETVIAPDSYDDEEELIFEIENADAERWYSDMNFHH